LIIVLESVTLPVFSQILTQNLRVSKIISKTYKTYKISQKPGLFDTHFRLEDLSKSGDPLRRLNQVINWECFRPVLENSMAKAATHECKGPAGRPAYDPVMLFKALILQRLNGLSDDLTEYMINDRLSFQAFLGLSSADKSPDAKTLWLFREKLTKHEVVEELFNLFNEKMLAAGIIAKEGSLVDASFVEVPKQRNKKRGHL